LDILSSLLNDGTWACMSGQEPLHMARTARELLPGPSFAPLGGPILERSWMPRVKRAPQQSWQDLSWPFRPSALPRGGVVMASHCATPVKLASTLAILQTFDRIQHVTSSTPQIHNSQQFVLPDTALWRVWYTNQPRQRYHYVRALGAEGAHGRSCSIFGLPIVLHWSLLFL
jgi:hypothetical protein